MRSAENAVVSGFLSFALLVLLSACGATSDVRIATPIQGVTAFTFLDERPSDNKASHIDEGGAGTSVFYGDDKLSPASPELTKTWLQKAMGAELGAAVDRNQLDAAKNTARASVPKGGGVQGAAGAALAEPIIYGMESAKSQKSLYVRIEGDFDQKPFSVIHSERVRGRVTERNVRNTIVRALDKLVSALRDEMKPK